MDLQGKYDHESDSNGGTHRASGGSVVGWKAGKGMRLCASASS